MGRPLFYVLFRLLFMSCFLWVMWFYKKDENEMSRCLVFSEMI